MANRPPVIVHAPSGGGGGDDGGWCSIFWNENPSSILRFKNL